MRLYQREAHRLEQARSLVRSRFQRFGVNKRRETVRLLYEISKRENITPQAVLSGTPAKSFTALKNLLLKRRYPQSFPSISPAEFYLPEIDFHPEEVFTPAPRFSPRRIVVEDAAAESALAGRFRAAFPEAECVRVSSRKEYRKGAERQADNYNRRRETVFIVNERFDFWKRCPCTRRAVPCGYHVFNLGFGCIYDCSYCYLQEYANAPGIVFPANLEAYFSLLASYRSRMTTRNWQRGKELRIGTGEFSDSLMLDGVTGYSLPIIEFFRQVASATFEFKTKSANIDNLLRARHGGNIVAAWSLNPERIVEENECQAARLPERLRAARTCGDAGYRLAFHFDPVFYYPGWEKEYAELVEELFSRVKPEEIAWISLGTFRCKPELKPVIENRFPANTILDGELVLGFDRKLRYPDRPRYRVYEKMIGLLKRHSPRLPVYLCMENRAMWNALALPFPFK